MSYAPAVNLTTSAGLPHLQAILYKKRGLDILTKKFRFHEPCMKDTVDKQSGKTAQWYRYQNLAANTTVTTEGTIGTSLSVGTRVVQSTVSQYSAFINLSDFLVSTAIDPAVQNASERLGYQAGLSVDTITRNVFDAEDSGTNQALLSGTTLKGADIRAAKHILSNRDVQPMDDGNFFVVMSPFVSFDLVNDPTVVGLADTFKYNTNVMNSPLVKYEDRGQVTVWGGCRVIESTNVKTASGPNTYKVYVFGKNGVGTIDLEGRGPQRIVDPAKERFAIRVIPGGPQNATLADPEGVIGAAVSYNFIFSSVVLEGPAGIGGSYRFITLKPQSTLG